MVKEHFDPRFDLLYRAFRIYPLLVFSLKGSYALILKWKKNKYEYLCLMISLNKNENICFLFKWKKIFFYQSQFKLYNKFLHKDVFALFYIFNKHYMKASINIITFLTAFSLFFCMSFFIYDKQKNTQFSI